MSHLIPGTQVLARGLQWEIVDVEAAGEQQRFRLRCLLGDLRGMEFDFLHPLETITPISTELDPTRAGRLKQWILYHEAFLLEQALGPRALLAVQPGRLDIAPYQLVPVMRALRMSRARLLLADGVGLGKTIEAGLVMAELIARRRAHRILIVSPAGPLLNQWQREMRERFGLRFSTIKHAGELQEARRQLILGSNPFDHVSLCLTSIDFAKQEKVLQDLERTQWDLVIIDEAHHCVRMGRDGSSEDSRRRRLAELLARQSDGLLLLTATPHDGFDQHFASVVELLDPRLIDGRGNLRGDGYRRHVIRRLKDHIKNPETGEPLFKKREVTPRAVLLDRDTQPSFSSFQQQLLELVSPRLRRAVRQRRYGEVLAFVSLLKRSVSSAVACRNTVERILTRYTEILERGEEEHEVRRQRLRSLREYRRRLERFGTLSVEEEEDQAELEAEDMAAELLESGDDDLGEQIDDLGREQQRERRRTRQIEETQSKLQALLELAEESIPEDPKLDAVVREIQRIRADEPTANVLVYTEFTDSQDAVVEQLKKAIEDETLSGSILATSGRAEHKRDRADITDIFSRQDNLVLVSTDSTAEGLNLQARCHHLIHLELPYNPNRLEQRNGRIDRYGQTKTPHVTYLYLAGTFEERLLMRLVAKYEKQRARLTFVPNTLGGVTATDSMTVRLLEGLADEPQTLFRRPALEITRIEDEKDNTGSPAYRELLAEVERAMSGYESTAKTHAWLSEMGLNAEKRFVTEASEARSTGETLSSVDVFDFVCRAVEEASTADDPVVRLNDGTIDLLLPSTWTQGLDDLPGFENDKRRLRLSADKDQTVDDEGDAVGYLGRAHPLVRRALDRVRNIQYGDAADFLDRRISAVAWEGEEQAILYTFLGAVESGNGREYERVFAVLVTASGEVRLLADPGDWFALANTERQLATKGLWEKRFSGWDDSNVERAADRAKEHFEAEAQGFLKDHAAAVAEERRELEQWLHDRTETLCGKPTVIQTGLFGGEDTEEELAPWRTGDDPTERLASYSTDSENPAPRRQEAKGILALHEKRSRELERRAEAAVLEPTILGLLMLVPDSKGGR